MLAAVMMHPDCREVVPLAPEPIEKQDGSEKNDCERNAAKRLLRHIRREHPHLKLIVVEDGLASNAPHIRELQNQNMHFILGAKPGDHPFLFDQVLTGKNVAGNRANWILCCDNSNAPWLVQAVLQGNPNPRIRVAQPLAGSGQYGLAVDIIWPLAIKFIGYSP